LVGAAGANGLTNLFPFSSIARVHFSFGV